MAPTPRYLLSYPRSGSTLLRQYLAELQGRPQLSAYPHDVVLPSGPPPAGAPAALAGLRVVKSHQVADHLHPAIHLVRDGRNAMLSNLYLKYLAGDHALERPEDVLAGFELLAATGELWSEHVAAVEVLASRHTVHTVRFEDLVADPVATVGAVLDAVGTEVAPAVIAEAVAKVSAASTYHDEPLSGGADRAPAGSIYAAIVAGRSGPRGADAWASVLDGPARRFLHERGATPHLLRLGYATSEDWWVEA